MADRPPISRVARLGDPYPAVAVAVAHDLGSTASAALATLIEARVRLAGYGSVQARPHHLGFELHSLVGSPEAAAQFVATCTRALSTPVPARGPAIEAARAATQALRAHAWTGPAESRVSACSGELGLRPGGSTPEGAPTVATLEQWRRAVYSTRAVAFSALGPDPILEAATEALRATEQWPNEPAVEDPWPEHDGVATDFSKHPTHRLSVALRVAHGSAAVRAAQALVHPDSPLRTRLASLDPRWQLTRVAGTTRPRGACLRLDLDAPRTDPPPRVATVAAVAKLALEEAELALRANEDESWTLEQSVLRPADPRQAAAVAAWRALSGRLEPGPLRRFVSYSASTSERGEHRLGAALRRTDELWKRPTLELRARVEPGQGELWALLATPCGNSEESGATAGRGAMLVRALAEKTPYLDGVTLEPWVSADGIGLLAHGPPADPFEQPTAHAARVADSLGRVLIGARLSGNDVAQSRARLLESVGPGPRPAWWLALESLCPDHPSWLEPRGTWRALEAMTTHAVRSQQRAFIEGPLRLAVLANWSEEQVPAVADALQRWLRPRRTEQRQCAAVTRSRPRTGRFELKTSEPTSGPSAYVAVPLPADAAGSRREAEWTVLLLNREGGWLDRCLREPGLVSSARARLVGGRRCAALVIEIEALPPVLDAAVAQVRGLLDRLTAGAATSADADLARAHFERLDRLAGLDPRHRIVHLWRGRASDPSADLASLRRFHRRTLRSDALAVVVLKPRS